MHQVIGERINRSISLSVLAQIVQQQGDAQYAIDLYNESLDQLRKMGIERSIGSVQFNLAVLVHGQGHYLLALKLYNECLEIFTREGDLEGVEKCQIGLAEIKGILS